MKALNYTISRIPVFLYLTIVAFNIIAANVEFSDFVYLKIYYASNELIGNSLITSIFMLLICHRNKLCWYNKVSVYGLIALNLINLVAISPIPYYEDYYTAISYAVMIPTSILAIILLIKGI